MTPQTHPLLEMRGIVKRFGAAVLANDHIDFVVEQGEVHALLGENGAGKSTLMQILYGMYQRDAGDICVDGLPVDIRSVSQAVAHGIGMVHQEFMLVEPFTVLENVVLGQGRVALASARARLLALSAEFGLDVRPDACVEDLTIGQRQRVEILKLLFRGARLLVLDEPTAVLTPTEVNGLFEVLRKLVARGCSVVIVTHKLQEIRALADRVTVLRQGRVVAAGLRVAETDEATMARAMVGRDVLLTVDLPPMARGEAVLEVRDLCVASGQGTALVNGVSLEVRAGEVLAIAGVDGNGQSPFAEAVMGLRPAQGRVSVCGQRVDELSPGARRGTGMGYLPADRRGVGGVMDLSLEANGLLGQQGEFTRGRYWLSARRVAAHAEQLIQRFKVRASSAQQLAGSLSGGNLQKLLLGREFSRQPRFLLLEQPTRGLDVGAIESVWGEILEQRKAGAAILLISAELEEVFNLADRIAVMYQGRIMGVLDRASATMELVGQMMGGQDVLGTVAEQTP